MQEAFVKGVEEEGVEPVALIKITDAVIGQSTVNRISMSR